MPTDSIRWRSSRLACLAMVAVALVALPAGPARSAEFPVDVVTHHNDNGRTGQALHETLLTPANVNAASFGKIGFLPVDGKVDAQPLYLSSVAFPDQHVHNVVYVATEHDSVFALDADSGALLWQVSLLPPGETTSDSRGCSQVVPEIGVTATPVIDRTRGPHGVLYVVAMSKNGANQYFQRLHALDPVTGAELLGGPVVIAASVPGTGAGGSLGVVPFDPKQYEERAALLLLNGVVYTAWTSHCDINPYTGWIIAYDAATLAQAGVLNVTPNGTRGAIWMAGNGPAADPAGNIYLLDGNGTFDTNLDGAGFPVQRNFGNGFLKLSPAPGLAVADYFATFDTVNQSGSDGDLGSGGAMVLPDLLDAEGQVRHLAIGAGKDQKIYVVDRDQMGKWNPSTNAIHQELDGQLGGSVFSAPAYFDGTVYYGAVGAPIKAFPISNARLAATPIAVTGNRFTFPGATPSISADGTANAILWAVENTNPAVLHAYDARDLTTELYASSQAPQGRDLFGAGNKFITPTIANGRVYVGTQNGVAVFGLLPGVPGAPTNLEAGTAGFDVTLTWEAPAAGPAPAAYLVEAGSGPALADLGSFSTGSTATMLSAAGAPAGSYYVRVRGQNVAGAGEASNNILLVLGVPGPPSDLTASTSGSTVSLTWTAPTLGGAPTSYFLEAGSAPGLSDLASFSTGTLATTLITAGVPPGTYYVRMKAENATGPSLPSDEIVVTVTE
jgi:outer membrane protein assembly factor BamB